MTTRIAAELEECQRDRMAAPQRVMELGVAQNKTHVSEQLCG